jgi:hypothetical protein
MESLIQLINQERQNADHENTIDIQYILSQAHGIDYLQNKTMQIVCDELMNIINQTFPRLIQSNHSIISKLTEYRFVENICDLHKGKHIRWIRLNRDESPKLTNGGIVTDIKFNDNGTHVQCKSNTNRFIQYKYDDCLTFQKLSEDELMILSITGICS